MRPTTRNSRAPAKLAWGLFVAALLLGIQPALAQDPAVTAAVPDMAEQETFDLVVTVSGNDFGAESQVDFFVTGTTDPGGITVKNVKRRNSKTLLVTLDIAATAQTAKKFDIQVRSGGRTGKGTELFSVVQKQTGGGDTTPPGEVTELAVLEADLGSALVTWRAPADDGYDGSSGTPARYSIRLRTDGPFTPESWDSDLGALRHDLIPAFVTSWPSPGEPATDRSLGLSPERTYWVAVRAYDEADNLSAIAQVVLTTPAAPPAAWLGEAIYRDCPEGAASWLYPIDLEIDLEGEPALLYSERCDPDGFEMWLYLARRAAAVWSTERLPLVSRDPRFDDLAFDPATGEPTLAHGEGPGKLSFYRRSGGSWIGELVERSQAGVASLAYAQGSPTIAYKRGASIRVAEKVGSRWDKSEFSLPSRQSSPFGTLHLVVDDSGAAAVAYGMDRDGDASAEVIGLAVRQGDAWQLERVDEVDPGWHVSSVSLAWDRSRGDLSLAYDASVSTSAPGSRIRTCDRTGSQSWACETVPIPPDRWPWLETTGLVFGVAGEATLLYTVDTNFLMSATRAPGDVGWSTPVLVAYDTSLYAACWNTLTEEPLVAAMISSMSEASLPAELVVFRRLP